MKVPLADNNVAVGEEQAADSPPTFPSSKQSTHGWVLHEGE